MSPELEFKVFSTPIPVTDEKPALTSTSCVRLTWQDVRAKTSRRSRTINRLHASK